MARILSLDQGTTSSRALVFTESGEVAGLARQEFTQHFPRPGWVEHDAEEIWASQLAVIEGALADAGAGGLEAIGITNQRETTVVWDRSTGEPIHPAIVWQDRRTASYCESLTAGGHASLFRAVTGLVIDPYFSGTKVRWLLENVDSARAKAEAGELAFGTIDSWLIWKLTGGGTHVIDATNASRTLLYDIHRGDWSGEILDVLDIPRALLPDVVPSSGVVAEAAVDPLKGVPIAGIAGDQQAALFGQACFEPGLAKNTYGTGCFLLMNTGSEAIASKNQLLTTIAWQIGDEVTYALEGSVFIGGAVVQWLRDGLGLIDSAPEIEGLAASVACAEGVVFVPAFAGLGAPHWAPNARGMITGLTRGTTSAHLARAALESIAFQVADLVDAMRQDASLPMAELRVDGGASANRLLLRLQADVLGCPVVRPTQIESTALGAAYLAGLATGVWASQRDIAEQWAVDLRMEPAGVAADVAAARAAWNRAVQSAIVHGS